MFALFVSLLFALAFALAPNGAQALADPVDTFPGTATGTADDPYIISTEADLVAFRDAINADSHATTGTDTAAYADKYFQLAEDIQLTSQWTQGIGISTSYYFAGHFDGKGHTISGLDFAGGTTTGYYNNGLFGYVYPKFNSVSIANVKVVGTVTGAATTSGGNGGLVGAIGSVGTGLSCTISNCVTDVDVTGVRACGGIVGSANARVAISDCLALGDITCIDGTGSSSNAGNAGGLVGVWTSVTDASMSNCLFLGQVTPSEGLLNTTSTSFVKSANGLIGKVGAAGAEACSQNCHYVAQSAETVGKYKAGNGDSNVAAAEGDIVALPTDQASAQALAAVMNGDSGTAWGIMAYGTGYVAAPEPFAEGVTPPAVTHTVTFDPDGGSLTGDAQVTVNDGEAVAQPTDPVLDGFTFDGWRLNGVAYDFSTPVTADITLVAHWTEIVGPATSTWDPENGVYKISTEQDLYNFAKYVNGMEPVNGSWVEAGTAHDMSGITVTLENDIALQNPATPVGIGTQVNVGSYYDIHPTVVFSGTFDGQDHTISNFTCTAASNPAYGTTATSMHSAGKFSALFGAVSGATIKNVTVELANGYASEGYLAGLVAVAYNGSNTIEHCAVIGDLLVSTESSASNEGTIAGGLVGVYGGSGANLAITHCYHEGNVTAKTGVGGLVGNAGTAGLTITSSYQAGTVTPTSTLSTVDRFWGVLVGSGNTLTLTDCVKDQDAQSMGANFPASSESNTVLVDGSSVVWDSAAVKANLPESVFDFSGGPTVNPPFKAYEKRFIQFAAGADDAAGELPARVTGLIEGQSVVLPACGLTRTDYVFVGWKASSDDTVYQPEESFTMPDANVTFTAQWSPAADSRTATFVAGAEDATGAAPAPISTVAGASFTVPANGFQRDAYTFAGWKASSDDAVYQPGNRFTMPDANVTFTAQWSPVEYTITYDLADGALPQGSSNPGTYTIETDTFTLVNPERENYTFAGWTGTGLEGATETVTISKGSSGDRSYVAAWRKNPVHISTEEQLRALAQGVNDGSEDSLGSTYILDNDIVLTQAFTPIGSVYSKPFKGTFDGNEHVISGLNVDSGSVTGSYAGLFGYVTGATIKNLGVEGTVNVPSAANAGGLVAYATCTGSGSNRVYSSIENCFSRVDVTGKEKVGGLAGYCVFTTVTDCYATGDVTGVGTSQNYSVGGLVGTFARGANPAPDAGFKMLVNSYAAGTVTAAGDAHPGSLLGDLITLEDSSTPAGEVWPRIQNCYVLESDYPVYSLDRTSCAESVNEALEMSAADLKVAAGTLGSAFKSDGASALAQINGGYPVLEWEVLPALSTVIVTVKPADATVSFVDSATSTAVEPSSSTEVEGGMQYEFLVSSTGSYTASASKEGYGSAGPIPIANGEPSAINFQLGAEEYAIEYDLGGAQWADGFEPVTSYTIESQAIALPTADDLVKPGFTFQGWFDNNTFSGEAVASIPAGSTGNKKFYASWSLDTYSIGYDLGGAQWAEGFEPLASYNINSPETILPTAEDMVMEGYSFNGWFLSDDFAGEAVTSIPAGSTGNKKFFASWTFIPVDQGWMRLSGSDRYATMAAIVGECFDSSSWAVLATGTNFPDALAASALAGIVNAPVIMTNGSASTLGADARAQLERLGVSNVYVVGGTGAVSAGIARELEGMNITVNRVFGNTRQLTAVEVLKAVRNAGSTSDTVIIATGASFADALSVAPWSYATASPIILTENNGTLSAAAVEAIKADGQFTRVVFVGGTGVVKDSVKTQLGDGFEYVRLGGSDRYATSKFIAEWELSEGGMGAVYPMVATGEAFPDALAGAAAAGKSNSILVLVKNASSAGIDTLAADSVKSQRLQGYVLGGPGAVSESTMSAIEERTL